MRNNSFTVFFVLIITFGMALALAILPMPESLFWFRPNWVTLVLIYWICYLPRNVGVLSGLTVGLLTDLLRGSFFGSQGLILSIVAFITINLRSRFRLAQVWVQSLFVLILVGFEQLISLWIQLLFGQVPVSFTYWLPTLVSVIAWPLVYWFLQSYQKKVKLHYK